MRTAAILAAVVALLVLGASAAQSNLFAIATDMPLLHISTVNGKANPVSGAPVISEDFLLAEDLSAYDPVSNTLYLLGYNATTEMPAIMGVSLTNGAVVFNYPLDLGESVFVGVGQAIDYWPAQNALLISGASQSDSSKLLMLTLFLSNNTLVKFAHKNLKNDIPVLVAAHAFDAVNEVWWIQYGKNDTTTGFITIENWGYDLSLHEFIFKVPDNCNFNFMAFSQSESAIVGIGSQATEGGGYETTIAFLNSQTGQCAVVTPTQGLKELFLCAIDDDDTTFWCYATRTGKSQSYFEVVGLSITDGSLVSAAKSGCTSQLGGLCPWTLVFGNTTSTI